MLREKKTLYFYCSCCDLGSVFVSVSLCVFLSKSPFVMVQASMGESLPRLTRQPWLLGSSNTTFSYCPSSLTGGNCFLFLVISGSLLCPFFALSTLPTSVLNPLFYIPFLVNSVLMILNNTAFKFFNMLLLKIRISFHQPQYYYH